MAVFSSSARAIDTDRYLSGVRRLTHTTALHAQLWWRCRSRKLQLLLASTVLSRLKQFHPLARWG